MTGTTLLTGARLVLPDRVVEDGWLTVADGLITELGTGPAPGVGTDLTGRWVVPGFVDIHVHGGGGATYTTGDVEQVRQAAEFHRGHGTTTTMASLVTGDLAELHRTVTNLAELVEDGLLAGIHLEGPYLSHARCGAHQSDLLRHPDPAASPAPVGFPASLSGGYARQAPAADSASTPSSPSEHTTAWAPSEHNRSAPVIGSASPVVTASSSRFGLTTAGPAATPASSAGPLVSSTTGSPRAVANMPSMAYASSRTPSGSDPASTTASTGPDAPPSSSSYAIRKPDHSAGVTYGPASLKTVAPPAAWSATTTVRRVWPAIGCSRSASPASASSVRACCPVAPPTRPVTNVG